MKKLLSEKGRKKVIYVNLNVFFIITKTTLSSMVEIVIWNIGSWLYSASLLLTIKIMNTYQYSKINYMILYNFWQTEAN